MQDYSEICIASSVCMLPADNNTVDIVRRKNRLLKELKKINLFALQNHGDGKYS